MATALLILLLVSCSKKEEKEISLEERLISQIDWNQDEYLESMDKESDELLTLERITYGHFTKVGVKEILAIFSIDSIHTTGLDRTIAAIYTADTHEFITQRSFAADSVELYVLEDNEGKGNLLFLGETVYQGIASSQIGLYDLSGGNWSEKKISELIHDDSDTYAMSCNQELQVFINEYVNIHDSVLRYKNTYAWDSESANFIRIQ